MESPFRIALPYAAPTVILELESDRPVSRFLAATIRGGFGYQLRRLVCTTPGTVCVDCILNQRCAYAYLFETVPPPDAPRLRSYKAVPRPFVLRPVQRGNNARIGLVLIGGAVQYLPYFIYAMNKLGEQGLGRSRRRFTVREVRAGDDIVYPRQGREAVGAVEPALLSIEPGKAAPGTLTLRFDTPLIIRRDGRVLERFEPRPFVTTLLRRITNLCAFHGTPPRAQIDPTPILAAAHTLRARSSMRRTAASRISTRQKKRIDYSGLTGTVTLEGDIGTLMPLLRAGEVLGVGKNTVFGQGSYEIV